MYNRYIPQPDGTYQKKRIPDPVPSVPSPPPVHKPKPIPVADSCDVPPPVPDVCPAPKPQPHHRKPTQNTNDSISGFIKQLLPKNFETADLLVLLLLLLMAGDCEEDRNNALLTMALYFFM